MVCLAGDGVDTDGRVTPTHIVVTSRGFPADGGGQERTELPIRGGVGPPMVSPPTTERIRVTPIQRLHIKPNKLKEEVT